MKTKILKPFALSLLTTLASCSSTQKGTDLTVSQAPTQDGAMAQPSFHTKGTPTGKPTGPLQPGEYWWNPQISPAGPVVVLVSLPLQTASVYRNGILVGRSSVSTGSKGHETPAGVFTILEKNQTHYSRTYDNAPMPNMQRLTWSGIAMHSGNLPGHAASHGCIRMPYDFSTLLFSLTSRGATVVIGDRRNTQPHFAANPGLILAPRDFTASMLKPLAGGEYDWRPERSTKGPVTILVSAADRVMYVYRNGQPIGRAAVEVKGRLGDHVFTMLEGEGSGASPYAPGRSAMRWMSVSGRGGSPHDLAPKVRFSPEFAQKLYDVLSPGATIIVTDRPAARRTMSDLNILRIPIIISSLAPGMREHAAYLPLYSGIESFDIGVPKGAKSEGLAPRAKPIVFYGTSITHGARASRPRMVHTAILGRRPAMPVINCGFSGNGEMDATVYVSDCMPNMQPPMVAERAVPLVKQLRAARPDTPNVLVEDRRFSNGWITPDKHKFHTDNHAALKKSSMT